MLLKLVIIIAITFLLFIPTSIFAEHYEWEFYNWQIGSLVYPNDGDTETAMTLTLPDGKINSQTVLLNYVGAFTDPFDVFKERVGGGFMQIGVVYPNFQIADKDYDDMDFFYSDGITPFPINHPYNVGAKYTFQIFYDNGWWLYMTDDVSNKETFIEADWASGELISAHIILENLGSAQKYQVNNKPNTMSQIEDVGTLSNIEDQILFIGSKAGGLYPASETIPFRGYEYEKIILESHAKAHHISPPEFVLFENNYGVYEVGFELTLAEAQENARVLAEAQEKDAYNQYSNDKIPNWIKDIFVWYGQDKISEDELLNAIKYLIIEKILIID